MSESTLSLQLSDFAGMVGNYLGFHRTTTGWSGWNAANPYVATTPDSQLGWIMDSVQSGYRSFLFPKALEGQSVAHIWSFLTPERTLNVVANQTDYDLPEDFAGMMGEMTYQPTDNAFGTIQRAGINQIKRLLQQGFGLIDKPSKCAVYPKPSDGRSGQRFAIAFYPIPDASYTLTYRASITPRALTYQSPWPLGGSLHAETIQESCLAVAEERYNDQEDGPHRQAFIERLTASIAVDQRDFRPEFIGYNGDRSDRRERQYAPGMGVFSRDLTPTTYGNFDLT